MDEKESDVPQAEDVSAGTADAPLTSAATEGTSDTDGSVEPRRDGGVLAQLRNRRSLAVAVAAAIATFAGGGAVGYAVGHSSDSGQHRQFGPRGFGPGTGPGFGGRGGRFGGMPGDRMGDRPGGQTDGGQSSRPDSAS